MAGRVSNTTNEAHKRRQVINTAAKAKVWLSDTGDVTTDRAVGDCYRPVAANAPAAHSRSLLPIVVLLIFSVPFTLLIHRRRRQKDHHQSTRCYYL